jgi:alkylation response protein AidB-like acyl-CoA dehydrogenase
LIVGAEEKKLGIKGSSTTQIILDNCKVPVENLLGEKGKGHKIAFNVLNIGRFKLGAGVCGASKMALVEGIKYANERTQFGKKITSFGAIGEKIANMTSEIYASESLVYRLAGLLDDSLEKIDKSADNYYELYLKAIEEYAPECGISKVFCSEVLARTVDEVVQIHGGYGYVSEYPAERFYRDERINRIFEGTNEINRLLIPGMLVRRAAAWHVPLSIAAREGNDARQRRSDAGTTGTTGIILADEAASVDRSSSAALTVLEYARQVCGDRFADEQEIAMGLADILADVLTADSVVLRAQAAAASGVAGAALQADAARAFVNDAAIRMSVAARQTVAAIAELDSAPGHTVPDLPAWPAPINTVALRRRIADEAVRRGAYPFR